MNEPTPPTSAPKQHKQTATAERLWFPVKHVWFVNPTSLPGAPARSELPGNITQPNVPRWKIEHGPTFRAFKVTFYTTNPKKEPEVRMVCESAVQSWEPML